MDIRLFKPSVGEEELANIEEVFERSWLGLGPRVSEFEKKWSEYIGCRTSIGVNSCTAALHLALSAFKFKKGKKVLVPVITFASTAMAILYNELVPVFVDVDEKTGGIDLDDLDRKYDKACVAVMPVHFGGHPVAMDKLMTWAKNKELKVIEDCAHTVGGEYKSQKLGTFGDIGCFSFEEKKCMTTGDGGMISSDDPDVLAPLRASRWVGINKDTWQRFSDNVQTNNKGAHHWYYEISDLGYKYNMNDLMAAIGLAQLSKIDRMNRRRQEVLAKYVEGIKHNNEVKVGLPYELANSSYWMFFVRVRDRERFILHMKKHSIATGVHYMPLTRHPLFQKYCSETPVADKIWKQFVTLPLFPDLTDSEVQYVIDHVNSYK